MVLVEWVCLANEFAISFMTTTTTTTTTSEMRKGMGREIRVSEKPYVQPS
jgi:hypothetical protein